MQAVARLSAPSLSLLRDAAGPPQVFAKKLLRFGRALSAYADGQTVDARLSRLHAAGLVEVMPTRLQLAVGGFDMLRFFIAPAAADYYRAQGIDFRFHQLLRFLDDPASLIDPIGLLSSADVIIGHVMQVVHANPAYDLQLLEAYEGGLDALESQVEAMVAGTHPRARSIGAIIEEPGYHARLLEYVRAYRRDRDALAPLRSNISSKFAREEQQFGTLPSAFRYFASLPRDLPSALRHVATVRALP